MHTPNRDTVDERMNCKELRVDQRCTIKCTIINQLKLFCNTLSLSWDTKSKIQSWSPLSRRRTGDLAFVVVYLCGRGCSRAALVCSTATTLLLASYLFRCVLQHNNFTAGSWAATAPSTPASAPAMMACVPPGVVWARRLIDVRIFRTSFLAGFGAWWWGCETMNWLSITLIFLLQPL